MAKNRNKKKNSNQRGPAPMDTSSDGFVTLPTSPQPVDTSEGPSVNLGASSINRKTNKGPQVRRAKNLKKMKSIARAVLTMEKKEEKVVKMKTKKLRIQSAKTLDTAVACTSGIGQTSKGRAPSPQETTTQPIEPARSSGVAGTPNLHSLLTLQDEHRLKSLIDGEPPSKLMIRHGYNMLPWDDRYEPYVRQAGFLGVQQIIGSFKWDDDLICALVERWRPETHTFHLPIGEMTITLEDVSILLGLPIHGTPVCGITDMQWDQVVVDNLGRAPVGKAMANKSALSLSWLRENFSKLDDDATEQQVQQFSRAYLLSLLGSVLFVDLTGDSVPCIYLPLLANLNQTITYSWGAAVLGRLYRQLCHASGKNAKQLGGCLLLLQMWAWERFPAFQPKVLGRHVLHGLTSETAPPRGFYWSGHHRWIENRRSLEHYRNLLDSLQDDDVEWLPYSAEMIKGLPLPCMMHCKYWLSTAALIDFAIVETYHPDRVMRQFGRYQIVPPPNRSTLRYIHAVDRQKFSKRDWREYHKEFVNEWHDRDRTIITEDRPYDPNVTAAYLEWYNTATIPTFAPYLKFSTDIGRAQECLRRPELSIQKMVENVIKFARKAARKIHNGADPHFANEAFKICREVVGTVDSISTFDRALANDEGEDANEESREEEENAEEEENLEKKMKRGTTMKKRRR